MLILAASMMVAVAPAPRATAMSAAICDVGRVALRDLQAIPTINSDRNRNYHIYYGTPAGHHDLLEACPELRHELPAGYPLADDKAWAQLHFVPDQRQDAPPAPTLIAEVDVPRVSADLKTATVQLGFSCTGLCGADFVAHYVRTVDGWRRDGDLQLIAVS